MHQPGGGQFIEIPEEDRAPGDDYRCARLKVAMYGTRQAAQAWENHYSEWLQGLGFVKPISCPNAFVHLKRAVRVVVHGDGFLSAGPRSEIERLREEMSHKYEAKHEPIGPGSDQQNNLKVLNRQTSWKEDQEAKRQPQTRDRSRWPAKRSNREQEEARGIRERDLKRKRGPHTVPL